MFEPFDPFDLPNSFDPLGSELPPPPRRRRGGAATAKPELPANPRPAHLLPPAAPPTPAGPHRPAAVDASNDMPIRLAALEDEVATLTARVDDLLALIDAKLDSRLLRAVASLVEQRR
jgi:hypothetical protein